MGYRFFYATPTPNQLLVPTLWVLMDLQTTSKTLKSYSSSITFLRLPWCVFMYSITRTYIRWHNDINHPSQSFVGPCQHLLRLESKFYMKTLFTEFGIKMGEQRFVATTPPICTKPFSYISIIVQPLHVSIMSFSRHSSRCLAKRGVSVEQHHILHNKKKRSQPPTLDFRGMERGEKKEKKAKLWEIWSWLFADSSHGHNKAPLQSPIYAQLTPTNHLPNRTKNKLRTPKFPKKKNGEMEFRGTPWPRAIICMREGCILVIVCAPVGVAPRGRRALGVWAGHPLPPPRRHQRPKRS